MQLYLKHVRNSRNLVNANCHLLRKYLQNIYIIYSIDEFFLTIALIVLTVINEGPACLCEKPTKEPME